MTHSLLETDGYKFSMAEAGIPLRTETFYYAHRKGGPMVIPIDTKKFVEGLLPTPEPRDYDYLDHHEYEMGAGYRVAMNQLLKVDALPKGAIFFPHEPAFSVTGPSALVSWLEPLLLQINYRIQLATCALSDPARLDLHMTCDGQEGIAKETLDAVQFIEKLLKSDAVVVAGQAASHCVKSSIEDLLSSINQQDPKLVKKVYILKDCMSAVAIPDGKGGFVADFTPQAEEALKKFEDAGMHVVESSVPMDQWEGF